MRRAVKTTLYVFLLFGYSCTGLLGSEAAGAPSPEETASNMSGGSSADEEVQGAAGGASKKEAEAEPSSSFPLKAFEMAFEQLAAEMMLPSKNGLNQYKAALKTLFKTTPEAFGQEKSRRNPHGLLKKMLAAKMERGSGGGSFNPDTFAAEFSNALKIFKNLNVDENMSPAEVIKGLAQSTKTQLTAKNAETLQQHITQTAQLLREVLPYISSSSEDEL